MVNPKNIFYKISGCGNDFIFIEDKVAENLKLNKSKTIKYCARKTGIGADGLIIFSLSPTPSWKFYNNDGGKTTFCGNAARSFIYLLSEILKYPKTKLFFGSDIGRVYGEKRGNKFYVEIDAPKMIEHKINNEKDKFLINSGVPHLIVYNAKLSNLDELLIVGQKYRKNNNLLKEGTNITFIDRKFNSITFERGVDYFTLACGTGAMAGAFALKDKLKRNKFRFKFPGGDLLVETGDKKYLLGGKVSYIYKGEIES